MESTLDDDISPQVHDYELEDVKKRSDKSVDELVDSIHQLTHHVQIGNGSDAIMFKVQCRLIWSSPDANIELWKELLKVNHNKKVSDLLEISCMYYVIESGAAAMWASKAINLRKASHRSVPHSAPTAPAHTHPAMTSVLHGTPPAMAVPEEVIGMQSATALAVQANMLLSPMEL